MLIILYCLNARLLVLGSIFCRGSTYISSQTNLHDPVEVQTPPLSSKVKTNHEIDTRYNELPPINPFGLWYF